MGNKLLIGALAATTALSCGPLLAQQNVAGNAGLEEIVVTARKRVENIQSVPDSIQALTAEDIEAAGVRSVNDVTRQISNFTLVEAQQPGVVLINIRGIGQVRNGEAPVAVVIDGVQQNSPNQITQNLYDVERIEVLKGPQGALYGRNAIGGAINIVTKAPTNELEGHIEGGVASGSDYTASAVLSGPIVDDRLLFRVSGGYEDRDGQIDNITVGKKVDFNESRNGRLALLYTPSDRFTASFTSWMQNQDAGASWYVPGPVNSNPTEVIGNLLGRAGRDLSDTSLKLEYEAESFTVTSISAYSRVESDLYEELDWLPADLLAATQTLDTKAWSQELRFSSAASARTRWTAGAYFLHTDRDLDTVIYLQPGLTGAPVPLPLAPTRSTDDNDAWAVFAQVDQPLADAWVLTAALRYDVDDRSQTDRNPPSPAAPAQFDDEFTSLQPKVSLAYTFDNGMLAYATAAKGFRSGGFNANDIVTREFKKEELWNYELGFKSELAGRRVRLNGSVFYTDITDRQVFGLDLSAGPNQFIANPIPKSHLIGAELELLTRPTPQLDFNLSLGWMNSKIDEYDTSVFAATEANGDFTGNKLNQTPTYTVSASTQYTWDFGGSSLSARADVWGAGGDYYWEIDNEDKRDALWLVDLRLAWRYGPLTVTGFARNVFDKRYEVEFVPVEFSAATPGDMGLPSPPRQVGVSMRWDF